MPILPKEKRLIQCLLEYVDSHSCSPSIRDLKELMEESSSSLVQDLLASLQQAGLINKQPRRARTLHVISSSLRLKGVVEAGYLLEHPREDLETVQLLGKRYQSQDYGLRVSGESMVEANILPEDLVIIRPNQDLWSLRPGQIGVIWIEGEGTTLKCLYHQEGDDTVTLKAASSTHPDRTIERQRVELQGVMIGHHRNDDGLWLAVDDAPKLP
ncbi:MAG: hypothetical protein HC922_08835 [Leptolyngbyaceae cyanobacterium SM2_3_12]|nr:hypothetical protein [Leptolyngbyaceae cyanobacterium SM2_3_12]